MKEDVTLDCECGKLIICNKGIIELKSDKEKFELIDYKNLVKSIEEISDGKMLPYLTDERGKQRYMDKESKKFMNDNLHKYVSACAVVEDAAVLRFLVHTFVAIYKPKFPLRMFKTPEEAKLWLVNYA